MEWEDQGSVAYGWESSGAMSYDSYGVCGVMIYEPGIVLTIWLLGVATFDIKVHEYGYEYSYMTLITFSRSSPSMPSEINVYSPVGYITH